MKWIAAITLIAIATSCSDGDHSPRNYVITQSQLENEDGQVIIDLMEQ